RYIGPALRLELHGVGNDLCAGPARLTPSRDCGHTRERRAASLPSPPNCHLAAHPSRFGVSRAIALARGGPPPRQTEKAMSRARAVAPLRLREGQPRTTSVVRPALPGAPQVTTRRRRRPRAR